MDLTSIPIFRMLRSKMSWLTERQRVLSENVANANTPGYAARDLQQVDFRKVMERENGAASARAARVSHPGHVPMTLQDTGTAGGFRTTPSGGWATSPTGNSVVLEEQMMKVADTNVQFQTAVNLYGKSLGLIRKALGGAGRA